MNDKATLDPFDDVPDSTDWLPTPLSGLSKVEAALRCQVCKDFYKTPMLTSCNHTFCSICIRRALSNDGKCPLCRNSEQEMRLRSNWSMEEVVTAFTKTRPDVLRFAKGSQEAAAETTKRKLEETESFESPSRPAVKRLRSSARLSKSRGTEAASEMARLEADTPSQEQDAADYEPDDGLVSCPICWQRMKAAQVDRHIDKGCPEEPQPHKTPLKRDTRSRSIPNTFSLTSSSPKKQPARTLERLPAVNYSMLKEPQLKKKLADLGISTAGSRQMLERRHREWTTIWNANCDSQYPRPKTDLMHDLDAWERTMGAKAPTSSRSLNMGAQIKDKDFDGAAWATKHDSSFKDLIANARRNKRSAEQKASGGEAADGLQKSIEGDYGEERNEEKGPTPQADEAMLASLEGSEDPRQQVDSTTQGKGVIDLTREVAPSDTSGAALSNDEGRKRNLKASSRRVAISR
ncbi:DNA repair protein rad18 [Hypoxylon sp. FL0543]|nr:DNA repair protein rad18 [Hypoxylon sp. FL0543]